MHRRLLQLVLLAFCVVVISHCDGDTLRRVKRASILSEGNATKSIGNVTVVKQENNTIVNVTNANVIGDESIKNGTHVDNVAVDVRAAITKMRKLQAPALRIARHLTKGQNVVTPTAEDKTCKAQFSGKTGRHLKKRNTDKDTHVDVEKQAGNSHIYVLSSEEFYGDGMNGNPDMHKKAHTRSHMHFEPLNDRDKLIDLLTGETVVLNETPKHLIELKLNDANKNSRFHGKSNKSKRNAQNGPKGNGEMTAGRHVNSHKDEREFDFKRSVYAAYKESPLIRLTKLLLDMGDEADSGTHTHNTEVALAPNDKVAEIIYKPLNFDSDDMGVFGLADSFPNELGVGAAQELSFAPVAYSEYPTQGSSSNAAPLKLLTNAIESGVVVPNKDDNDNDEYEMTCPVHFKRSLKNGAKDGELEVCSCHLYRKKKQII